MTAQLAPLPQFRNWDNNGNPLFQGFLYTYAAGTTTPQATYTDSTQTTQNTNPVVLNARGEASVWLNPSLTYKFVLQDQFGNTLWTQDQIPGGFVAVSQFIASVIAAILAPYTAGPILNSLQQTAAEIAAGITPTNYAYAPNNVKRYGATGNGTTDDTAAIQTALTLAGTAGYTSVFFPIGTYKVSSTLTIPGVNITLYGEGAWASQITNAITGNPANHLFSWTANSGGTTGQFLQVQGLRINGNGATGSGGNGHAFALLGDLGVEFANFVTFRDCYFVSLQGNGKNSAGSAVAAAGIYCYFGDVVKVENCIFEECNQGIMIDGNASNTTQKVCVSACTFDNLASYGVQALYVTNLLVNNQTIFNNMAVGVYLNQCNETATIDDCRFKIMSSNAVNAVGTLNVDQLNITNNYFYTTFQSSVSPVLDLGSNVQGLQISGNEFLFDSTVVNGQAIVLQNPSGFIGGATLIQANRFTLGGSTTTLQYAILANNGTNPWNNISIIANFFGQGYTPSASESITTAIALTGSAGGNGAIVMGNTFFMNSPGAITTAISVGSGWTGTLIENNVYVGNITTNVSNSGTKTVRLESGSQTLLQSFDTLATTGTKTATFSASNKPGTNNATAPANWLPIVCDGATYYIPLFST